MRADYLCPCLLFIGGAIWLSVSAYFAATNWIDLTRLQHDWVSATCALRQTLINPCSVLDSTQVAVQRCKVNLMFAPIFRNEETKQIIRSSSNTSVSVQNPGDHRGCVFENCADARKWAEKRFPSGRNSTQCWALRNININGIPTLRIDNPSEKARRDSIIFTVCSGLAAILVLAMLFVIVGLVVRDCKDTV